MEIAGVVFAALASVLIVFQVGLALGAPWGVASYGGSHEDVLPTGLRIVSAVAGFAVYPFVTVFVLDAAGVIDTGLADGDSTATWLWVLTAFFAVQVVLNAISRSKVERVWAPVVLVMSVCCGVIAAGI